jgi:hypothetical protein
MDRNVEYEERDDPLEHDGLHEHPLCNRFEACNIRIALCGMT